MGARVTNFRLLIAVLAAAVISACSGGGSTGSGSDVIDTSGVLPGPSGIQITGTVTKGPLDSSDLEFLPIDAFGVVSGAAVATATTGTDGGFNATIPSGSGNLLIRTSGGTYVDEADREVDPALKRRIVLNQGEGLEGLLPAGSTTATVSIATQALLDKTRRETRGGTFMQQFAANRELAVAAFGFDIVSTPSANPVSPDPASAVAERQYAMVLGGLANLINRVTLNAGMVAPTIETIMAVAEDFSDGRIDGMVDGAAVMVAGDPITTFSLNEEIARFRNNNFDSYAGTPLTVVDENIFSQTGVAMNVAPVGVADSFDLPVGGSLTIAAPGVLDNDTDADGNPLTAELVPGSGPANATQFSFSPDGAFSYSHDGSGPAIDGFSYTVSDGLSTSGPVAVTLSVLNARPVANDDLATVAEGGLLAAPSVLLNDTDADQDPLTAVLVDPPANGQLQLNADGTYEYTHDGSETASDQFIYVANDGSDDSLPAAVNITVTPVNDAPVANPDSATVDEGGTITTLDGGAISVLNNDTDAELSPLTAVLDTPPVNGQLFFATDGTFTYSHDGSETTSDSFRYTVSDGMATSALTTVSITINPVNDLPLTVADSLTVDEGGTQILLDGGDRSVLDNDTDGDLDPLTAVLADPPANGQLVFNSDGTFSYEHDGSETTSDSFVYVANDGTADSAPTAVSIVINPVNDAPVAVDDEATVDRGGSVDVLDSGEVSVLANDTDAENDMLTAQLIDPPSSGQVFFDVDGAIDYIHDGSPGNFDSFTYVANDGIDDSLPATVTISVNNLSPLAVDDGGAGFTTDQDTSFETADVLVNDDLGDQPTSITDFDIQSTQGAFVDLASGGSAFFYSPAQGFSGSDTFTYTITDSDSETSTATVTITVNPGNQPPTAIDLDNDNVDEGQPDGTVVGVFSTTDPDVSDVHIYALVSGPGGGDNGFFTIVGDELLTVTPLDAQQTPMLGIRVQTDDQNGGLFEETFVITVNDVPNPRAWINPLDGEWSDPANWSPFGVPEPGDAVQIDVGVDNPVITMTGVAADLSSIDCAETLVIAAGSSLTVRDIGDLFGSTSVQGELIADGPSADLSISGSVSAESGDLIALNGGTLSIQDLASFTSDSNQNWSSEGAGSAIRFLDTTSITVGMQADTGATLGISATNGGLIDLPVLTGILIDDGTGPGRNESWVDTTAVGTGSRIQMPQLLSYSDADGDAGEGGLSIIEALDGGVVEFPLLTAPRQVRLIIDIASSVDIAQFVAITDSVIELEGGVYDFPNLIDLSRSIVRVGFASVATVDMPVVSIFNSTGVEVYNGTVLSLPGVTNYAFSDNLFEPLDPILGIEQGLWAANGVGSRLELPNLSSAVVAGIQSGPIWNLRALAGGIIDLPALTSLVTNNDGSAEASGIFIEATDAGSLVQMPMLTTFTDFDTSGIFGDDLSSVLAQGGGAVEFPLLTDADRVLLRVQDAISSITISQFTALTNSAIDLYGQFFDLSSLINLTGSNMFVQNGASVDLSAVTMFDNAGIEILDGAVVSLPGVTSYTFVEHPGFMEALYWYAEGDGSRLVFPNLTSVQLAGNQNGPELAIETFDSGVIDLPMLGSLTVLDDGGGAGSRIELRADGLDSLVDLPVLTTFTDNDLDSMSTVTELDAGVVNIPGTAVLTNVSVNGNQAPTAINLDNDSVVAGQPPGTPVGTFSTIDSDTGDTHVYTLVNGAGSDDNALFQIVGDQLQTATVLDMAQSTRSILVQTDDQNGGTYQELFIITVNPPPNSPPIAIDLDNDIVDEGEPGGTVVGIFTTTDPDTFDFHTYALVPGAGADDNAFFSISNDALQTVTPLNAGQTPTLSIRVQTDDQNGGLFEAVFTIIVNDLPEAFDDGGVGFVTDQDQTFATANVLLNDDLGDQPTTITDFDTASEADGTVDLVDTGVFSYTPPASFSGDDNFSYVITDNDGDVSVGTVTITVNNVASANANLSDLVLTDVTLDQPFTPAQANYTATVGFPTSLTQVTPTAEDAGASIMVNGADVDSGATSNPIALAEGVNNIAVTVLAEDGVTAQTYMVDVTRQSAAGFAQQAYIKASNTGSGDRFGWSTALSDDGNTLVVGTRNEDSAATGIDGDQNDNSATSAGAVYAFVRDGGGIWSQQAYIKASNTDANDFFGSSVALSGDGNTLAVGAASEASNATGINGNGNDNSSSASGAAYVFDRVGVVWSQQAYIKTSNSESLDQFGWSVALSEDGDTLAVSAASENSAATGINGDQNNNGSNNSGAVYTFSRAGIVWSQQAYIKASNTDIQDVFGSSVALSANGNTLAVTATGEDSAATGIGGDQLDNSAANSGAMYVFTRDVDAWSQQAYIKASNADAADFLGQSVAMSDDGNTIAVSTPNEDSAATGINGDGNDNTSSESGAAYLFNRVGAVWSEQAYVKASNTSASDQFGASVALSGDGNTLAVGARLEDSDATGIDGDQNDNLADAGAVYSYSRDGGGAWSQQSYIKAANTGLGDNFGSSVALSNSGVLSVGAINEGSNATGINGDPDNDNASQAGAAYVFDLPPATQALRLIDFENLQLGDGITAVNSVTSTLGVAFDVSTASQAGTAFNVVTDPNDAANQVVISGTDGSAADIVVNFDAVVDLVRVTFPDNMEGDDLIVTMCAADITGSAVDNPCVSNQVDLTNGTEPTVLTVSAPVIRSVSLESASSEILIDNIVFRVVNELPTGLTLGNSTVVEGLAIGAPVGSFSTQDPDAGDTHVYSLVAGTGDADNASFQVVGDELQTAAVFDAGNTPTLNIRVQTDDQNGGIFQQTFVITVTVVTTTRTWITPIDGDWADPANWSPFGVPEPGDAVVIDIVGAAPTITISGIQAEVFSIDCDEALVVEAPLTIHGPGSFTGQTVVSGGAIFVDGTSADVFISGSTLIVNSNLVVTGGGQLSVPSISSFFTDGSELWFASGPTSRLEFPNLAGISVGMPGADQGASINIEVNDGGVIDFPLLGGLLVQDGTSLSQNPGFIDVLATDAGSRIQMPQLNNFSDFDPDGALLGLSALEAQTGGTIDIPLLTVTDQVRISIDGSSFMDVVQLQSVRDGVLNLDGGSYNFASLFSLTGTNVVVGQSVAASADFPAVTNFDFSGVEAANGSTISLPQLTTYFLDERTLDFNNSAVWRTDGPGTTLMFPNLAGIQAGQGTTDNGPRLAIEALNGSEIALPLLTAIAVMDGDSINARRSDVDVLADGTNSLISMPSLFSFTDADERGTEDGASLLAAVNGGTIQIPLLTAIDQVSVTVGTQATVDVAQITTLTNAVLTLDDGSYSFPNLTDLSGSTVRVGENAVASVNLDQVTSFDNAGVEAYLGSVVSLPGVNSYFLNERILHNDEIATWAAGGAGSRVEFPNLTNVQVGDPADDTGPNLRIDAQEGAVVDLPAVTDFVVLDGDSVSTRRSDIDVYTSGMGSVVQMPLLTNFVDNDSRGMEDGTSALQAFDHGFVNVPLLTAPDQVSITFDAISGVTVNQLTALTNGVLTLLGATEVFPNLVDLTGSAVVLTSGASADLSSVVLFDGGGAEAYDGSVISLPGLGSYMIETNNFGDQAVWRADGSGSQIVVATVADIQVGIQDSGQSSHLDIEALNGGEVTFVELSDMTVNDSANPQTRDIDVLSDGLGSIVDLGFISTFFDFDTQTSSRISQLNGGVVSFSPSLAFQNVTFLP